MKWISLLSLLLLGISHRAACADVVGSVMVGANPSDIKREALSLVQRTRHSQPGEELRVIPGLVNLTCSGSITSLLFIAGTGPSQQSSLTFSLWSPTSVSGRVLWARMGDSREVTQSDIEVVYQPPPSGEDVALYRATLSPPLEFKKGELFGIGQGDGGLALQYAYGLGPENFVVTSNSTEPGIYLFTSGSVAVRDLPLLALENYNCGTCGSTCVNDALIAAMDLKPFLEVTTTPEVLAPFLGSPEVSPLLRFTSDGSITRWSVRGTLPDNQLPQLEIWRANDTSQQLVYQMVQSTTTNPAEQRVSATKTFVTQDISFRQGDVLGVRHPGMERVVLGDILLSPDSYAASGYIPGAAENETQSGVIQISLSIDLDGGDDESETTQSIAEPVIPTKPAFNDTHSQFEFSAFPKFSIPHNGLLRRWLFAAQLTPALSPSQESLQLQVWRKAPNVLMETYRLVHSTNVSLHPRGEGLASWEITLKEPVPVEAGDILGFHQPPSELQLALLTGSEMPVHELTLLHAEPFVLTRSRANSTQRAAPLMAAEVVQSGAPSVSPTLTPTTAVTTEDDEPLLSREEIIVMVTVSGAVLLVGAVVVAVLILCCCRKLYCKESMLQYKSSLYYKVQRRQSDNSLSSQVYLKTQRPVPEPDSVVNGRDEPVMTTMTFT